MDRWNYGLSPFFTGSGSGVLRSKRFLEALRDLGADLFEGVALGGRDVPDLSGFDEVDVGVFTGELGELGPLRSCRETNTTHGLAN